MGDRFDPIFPPLTSFLESRVIEEIKKRESDFSLSLPLVHFCYSFYEMNIRQKNNLSIQSSIRLWMLAKKEEEAVITLDTCTFL
jgi:hypothetical protein